MTLPVGAMVDADEDKLSDALSVQFDQYLLQFNQVQQQPFGLDEEFESFDNLFPGFEID